MCYFYRILRKIKSIYIAGKCLGHPFLNFLDPPMSVTYVFGILHFVRLVSRFTFQRKSHGLQGLMGYPKQRMVVLCRLRPTGPQAGGLKILKIQDLELVNQKVII